MARTVGLVERSGSRVIALTIECWERKWSRWVRITGSELFEKEAGDG